jgi:hypothetical protein
LTRAVQWALNCILDPAGAHAADRDGPTVPRDELRRLFSHLRELSEQLLKIVSLL